MRDGSEQITEFAEGVVADGTVVVDEVVRFDGALSDVDVEVIFPEVGHHFLELTLAAHGAGDAGRLELGDEGDTRLVLAFERQGVGGVHRHGGISASAFADGASFYVLGEIAREIILVLLDEGVCGGEELVRSLVVDPLGVELLVDPAVEAESTDGLDVAGTGAKGEAVQRLGDLLIGGLLAVLRLLRHDRRSCRHT
jgi:hypothetical protein